MQIQFNFVLSPLRKSFLPRSTVVEFKTNQVKIIKFNKLSDKIGSLVLYILDMLLTLHLLPKEIYWISILRRFQFCGFLILFYFY